MATSAEAIEAIVKAAGIPPATVARAARTLKEAGGINAVHVQPHHLARNTGSIPAMVEPQADFASEALENSERKIETSAPQSTGPTPDVMSQPGANPVNVDAHPQRSDDVARTQPSTSRPGSLRRLYRARHVDEKEAIMPQLKIADTVRILNAKFGINTTYMKVHAGVTAGLIPAKRTPSGSGWLILESDLPTIAALLKAKPKAA